MSEELWKKMVSSAREAKENFNDMPDDRAIIYAADTIKALSRPAPDVQVPDDLLLIESVLKGYPASFARNDALGAVRRLLAAAPAPATVATEAGTVWVPARQSAGQERGEAVAEVYSHQSRDMCKVSTLNARFFRSVPAGTKLYAAPTDAQSRIAELEAQLSEQEKLLESYRNTVLEVSRIADERRRQLTERTEREGRMREALTCIHKIANEEEAGRTDAARLYECGTHARAALAAEKE